jgi:hypothetical protein
MVSVDLGLEASGQRSAVADEVFALGGASDVSDKIWVAEYVDAGCIVQDNHVPKIETGVSKEGEEGIIGRHSCDLTVGTFPDRVGVRSTDPIMERGEVLLEGFDVLG